MRAVSGVECNSKYVGCTVRERPQLVVPVHARQRARSRGAWTLVGCTVSPAFRFEGFALAPKGFEP